MASRVILGLAAVLAIVILVAGFLLAANFLVGQRQMLMKTDKEVYDPGEVAKVRLVNLGSTRVWTGSDFLVERLEGGEWVFSDELTPDYFTLELRILEPGGSMEWTIALGEAEPGEYRVVKEVWLDSWGEERVTLYAYFRVRG